MNNDTQIRDNVEEELYFEPSFHSAEIGVGVQDGVVTLTGTVDTYAQKLAAVHSAERVALVKAVACEIEVRLPGPHFRTDAELARAAANALAWNSSVPENRIRVSVDNGWIALEGTVDWQYQRDGAATAVSDLMGVRGVENLINVNPMVKAEDIKKQIQAALRRSAIVDSKNILVEVAGDKVALYGDVRSIPERDEVERIAWSAPGVSDVADRVSIAVPRLGSTEIEQPLSTA